MKRMYGWEEIAKKVDDYIPEKDNIFVFSDNYHIASELSFYSRRFDRAFCINEGRRMNQFDLWSGINQFSNQNYDGIYVSKSLHLKKFLMPSKYLMITKSLKSITVTKWFAGFMFATLKDLVNTTNQKIILIKLLTLFFRVYSGIA